MQILTWLVVIVGGGLGLLSILAIIVYSIAMLGYKLVRKIKYGTSLYD